MTRPLSARVHAARVALVTLVTASATLVTASQAQPRISPWQRVTDPGIGARTFIQHFADHKREPRDADHATDTLRVQLNRACSNWIERVAGPGLESSQDSALLFLYGECLAYAGPGAAKRAAPILQRALELAPLDPHAPQAWNTLGRVHAALGELDAAYSAFERALEREWDVSVRSAIQIEQGLLTLAHGQFDRAIERLSSARDATTDPVAWALSQWALGVAMDRAWMGPEGAALAWTASQGRFGVNGEFDVLALPGVGPEPASEATYYRALALMGKVQTVPQNQRTATYLEAKFLWLTYLREVDASHPAVPRVRAHMAHIEKQTAGPDDDALLDQAARAPMQLGVEPEELPADHMIWPEELTEGDAFWGADAGTTP